MHCKQADSVILKLLLAQASMEKIYFITKQTYVAIMHSCRPVAFTRILSLICAVLGWFCANVYADIKDLTQILRKYLDKKSAAESSAL